MRAAAWLVSAVLVQGAGASLTCSKWQGIRTCSSPDGYVSHVSTRNEITTGDDNQGGKWSSWCWQGLDVTTSTPER